MLEKYSKKRNYKIGILGGTFDPPHKGHLYISKFAIKNIKLDELIWIVTKQNPLKGKPHINLKNRIRLSKKITSKSIVLIGDAAHSLHPIAGQGLNLSIKDIIELKNKINHYKYLGYKLGNSISLDEYEEVRQIDNTVYTFATNYLDKVFKSRNYIINTISNLGIANIERNNTLKNIIIKSATGQ